MSTFFDRIWKKKSKIKQNEIKEDISKSVSSLEDIGNSKKSKKKEKKKRLEVFNSKIRQSTSPTSSFLSPLLNISKKININENSTFKEFDAKAFKEVGIDTTIQNICIEDGTSLTNYKINKSQSSKESMILANDLEVKTQTSHTTQGEDFNSNPTNLHNSCERISINIEDEFGEETFNLQKWIDKQIDSNSHLYSLDTQKHTPLTESQFESYFNSNFDENYLKPRAIIKEYSGNKIPYKRNKDKCPKDLKELLYSKDANVESIFENYDLPNEDEKTLSFKNKPLNETLDASINENDNDESYNYKSFLDDCGDIEHDISLQELQFLNKNHEKEQFNMQSTNKKDTNCFSLETSTGFSNDHNFYLDSSKKHKLKGLSRISKDIRDKLKLDKVLFYDSISSVQPYLQDNLEGPISQPNLKVESAQLSNIHDISPYSNPKPNLIKNNLKDQKCKNAIQRTSSLKEIFIHNKEPITSFDEFRQLPTETQIFLDKIQKQSSLRLSNYQQVADKVITMPSIDLKAELETMYKLDNDLKNISESVVITSTSKIDDDNSNLQNLPLKKKVENQASRFSWDKKRFIKNSVEITNGLEIQKKKRKRANDKILRNIQLGPNARYYRLTPEEEELVEKILAQPSNVENQTNDGCSIASFASTGYVFDEDDAKRIAEIDVELEHLQHQSHESCSVSSQCGIKESDHRVSTYESIFSSKANSIQCEISSKLPSISTKQGNNIARSKKITSNYGANKIQKDCISIKSTNTSDVRVKHYLEEQRMRRESEKRIKEIDKMLKGLENMEPPKLTEEELETLIIQCKYEQGLLSTREINSNLLDSTSQSEGNSTITNFLEYDKMLDFDEVMASGCATIHFIHPETTLQPNG